jgi:multidrug resistance protein MdtO
VRTVTVMRLSLASVLRADAELLRLIDTPGDHQWLLGKADGLRDRAGKTVAALRSLNDVVVYDFGANREEQIREGETILRAAFNAVGLFWNQLSVLHSEQNRDFLTEAGLIAMRRQLAQALDSMAAAVVRGIRFSPVDRTLLADPSLVTSSRFNEYTGNTVKQYADLEAVMCTLGAKS